MFHEELIKACTFVADSFASIRRVMTQEVTTVPAGRQLTHYNN